MYGRRLPSPKRHQPKKPVHDSVGAGAGMMRGWGLYGRPLLGHHTRSCSMTPVHRTRATRAAIKAPTPPHAAPAPTGQAFVYIPSVDASWATLVGPCLEAGNTL